MRKWSENRIKVPDPSVPPFYEQGVIMVTVGDRIKEAIDDINQEKLELALSHVCIAIDITARKLSGAEKSKKTDYKKFLLEYMWLITYMGIPGLMAPGISFNFKHKDIKSDAEGRCGIEDVIYHVIRCGLIHSTGADSKIVWSHDINISDGKNLVLPDNLIWGLIGAVVFCPANKDELIPEIYWISIDGFKFFIQEIWGRVDLAQRVIKLNFKI